MPIIVPSRGATNSIGRSLPSAVFWSLMFSQTPSPFASRGTLKVRPMSMPFTSWYSRFLISSSCAFVPCCQTTSRTIQTSIGCAVLLCSM